MGKTHWSGPLLASDKAMGGAAEELDNMCLGGESDMITVFDDFNDVMPALAMGEADTADNNVNPYFESGWVMTDVGAGTGSLVIMNDAVGGQLPYNSCLTFYSGTAEDSGGNCQLDQVACEDASEDDWLTSLAAKTRTFPHIWIDDLAAGATILDNTTYMFACRLGLRSDTWGEKAGAGGIDGVWDSKCFVGWAVTADANVMTAATGAITIASTGELIGFHVPEDGSIDGISHRTVATVMAEGTNFTELAPAGAVNNTVVNGVEAAGDTTWWDLALRMDITDMSDDDANGYTTFYTRRVLQNASAAPGSSGFKQNPWNRHTTVLANQTPNPGAALVPTVEIINGPTAGADGVIYLDWWAFGKSRTSRLSKSL